MENEKLIGFNGEFGVRSSFVVAEFNFVDPVQQLNYRAYLAAYQVMLR